jgi:hypothetical protein
MKKRIFHRISVSSRVPAKIVHNGDMYEGKVVNISNLGVYLESETPLPFDSRLLIFQPLKPRLELLIPLNEKDLRVSVKLKRYIQNDDCHGIGVEVINPDIDYLEFVDAFRPSPETVMKQ